MLQSSIDYLNFEFCRFALTKDLIGANNKMWQKEFSLYLFQVIPSTFILGTKKVALQNKELKF